MSRLAATIAQAETEGMLHCYLDPHTRAIADLTWHDHQTMVLNRINVPWASRGFGHGSRLLRRVTTAADTHQVTLVLDVCPSGPLDWENLHAWYHRNGFTPSPNRHLDGVYDLTREPR